MADDARDSDRILAQARQSLVTQRAGGRRVTGRASIGRRSAQLKRQHLLARLRRALFAIAAVVVATMGAGLVLNGIGLLGLFLAVLAAVVIGGASLSGGRGSVAGTLVGAMIMTAVANGCTKLDLPNWVQEIVTGVIIVSAVALDRFRRDDE